jgi:mRNA interferase MazF
MTYRRGDIVVVSFPFSSGAGAKARPALVIQCDVNNRRLTNIIVAAITTTTHRSGEPTQLLIEVATPTGQQSGLVHDSVVTCENLATIEQRLIRRKLGTLPTATMTSVSDCLKASLQIA